MPSALIVTSRAAQRTSSGKRAASANLGQRPEEAALTDVRGLCECVLRKLRSHNVLEELCQGIGKLTDF